MSCVLNGKMRKNLKTFEKKKRLIIVSGTEDEVGLQLGSYPKISARGGVCSVSGVNSRAE